MDQDTQKNAAMVEETTAATHSLSREVGSLNELLRLFKLSESAPSFAASASGARAETAALPVKEMSRRLSKAFSSNGATAVKMDEWQEF